MTWTYSGDPSASDRDFVRFWLGDTDTTDQQLSDEEIAALLTIEGSPRAAALSGARRLLAKYSRLVDKSVGDLSVSYSQRRAGLETLIGSLKRDMVLAGGMPISGGQSKARKETVEADTDRVKPSFHRDQFTEQGGVTGTVSGDDESS